MVLERSIGLLSHSEPQWPMAVLEKLNEANKEFTQTMKQKFWVSCAQRREKYYANIVQCHMQPRHFFTAIIC